MWSSPRIYFRAHLIHTLYQRYVQCIYFVKTYFFADDTNLLFSGKDIDELCSVVSIELDKLCICFQVNKLSLNTSKTNVMVFTNRSCDDTYTVCMNGLNLSRVFVTQFLGVHMDSKLDWNYHY